MHHSQRSPRLTRQSGSNAKVVAVSSIRAPGGAAPAWPRPSSGGQARGFRDFSSPGCAIRPPSALNTSICSSIRLVSDEATAASRATRDCSSGEQVEVAHGSGRVLVMRDVERAMDFALRISECLPPVERGAVLG